MSGAHYYRLTDISFRRDVITRPCHKFIGGLVTVRLHLGHGALHP